MVCKTQNISFLELICLGLLFISFGYVIFIHINGIFLPYDDAYITYKYVNNLLAGKGLVYNEGHRVFGVSTPLYLLFLTVMKLIFHSFDVSILSVRMNFIFYLTTALSVFLLIRLYLSSTGIACIGTILLLLNRELISISMGGMESFLFTSLVFWSLWALSTSRFCLGALLGGSLAVLTRPEGIFSAALCVLLWSLYSRAHVIKFFSALTGPGLLWGIFSIWYFGTPIPHSIIAKSQPLYPLPPGAALQTIGNLIKEWTINDLLHLFWLPKFPLLVSIGLLGLVTTFFITYRKNLVGNKWYVVLLFFLFCVFYSISNLLIFPWYEPPLYIMWFLILFVGLIQISLWISDKINKYLKNVRYSGAIILIPVLIIVLLFLSNASYPYCELLMLGNSIVDMEMSKDPERYRIIAYKKAAEQLNKIASSRSRIVAAEVGSFGYYSTGYIIDACGLVSPEALRFLPVPKEQRQSPWHGVISVDLVKSIKPDYVVTMKAYANRSLLISSWFFENYELLEKLPLLPPQLASENVFIFKRKDV